MCHRQNVKVWIPISTPFTFPVWVPFIGTSHQATSDFNTFHTSIPVLLPCICTSGLLPCTLPVCWGRGRRLRLLPAVWWSGPDPKKFFINNYVGIDTEKKFKESHSLLFLIYAKMCVVQPYTGSYCTCYVEKSMRIVLIESENVCLSGSNCVYPTCWSANIFQPTLHIGSNIYIVYISRYKTSIYIINDISI